MRSFVRYRRDKVCQHVRMHETCMLMELAAVTLRQYLRATPQGYWCSLLKLLRHVAWLGLKCNCIGDCVWTHVQRQHFQAAKGCQMLNVLVREILDESHLQ